MTVDVAALVLEVDARPVSKATAELREFTAESGRAEKAAKKLTATQQAGIGVPSQKSGAAKRATEYVTTLGAVEKATRDVAASTVRAAAQEAAAWDKVDAALQRRNAAHRGTRALDAIKAEAAATAAARRLELQAMREIALASREYERSQAKGKAAADALRASVDPLAASIDRLNDQMAEAKRLNASGFLSDADSAKATTVLTARLNTLQEAHTKGAGAARLQSYELVNFGRQLGDVGTMAAMGASPFQILATQGFQVAEIFGTARARGVTLKDALADLARGVGALVATWGPLIVAGGAVIGAFMLWRKYTNDVKAALESAKKATQGFVEGQRSATDALGQAADFAEKYKVSTTSLTQSIDGLLVSQNAAYRETMEGIGAMDAASQAALRRAEMERLATVAILRRGAAEAEARAKETEKDLGKAKGTAFWPGLVTAVGLAGSPGALSAGAAAQADKLKQLGGPEMERAIANERALATALKASADELMRAELTLPKVNESRAKGASATEKAAKQAEAEATRAREATAAYIVTLEQQLAATGQTANAVRRLAADREIELALMRGDVESATRIKALVLETEKTEELAEALEHIAKTRKAVLAAANEPISTIPQNVVFDKPDVIAEMAREFDKAAQAAADIRYAVDDVYYGIREKNWAAAFAGLFSVIKQLQAAFDQTADKSQRMGAVGGVLTGVGGAVGGKAGNAISAVGSGFSAAGSVGAAATVLKGMGGAAASFGGAIAGLAGPIGIAVAGFSLLSGILGDQKAKKRAKLEQEARDIENARAIAQERANKQAELELRILELSGDEVGALTRKREAELAALDGANRALQMHVNALEDWAKAIDAAKSAVSKAEDDLRAAYQADKDRLNGIIGGVETARDRLNQAYQRERGVIEGTISSVRSLVDSLSAFRVEMDMMAAANDPSRQYGYASRQFATASNDNLIERGRAFAEASQSASATDLDFQRDLAAVRRRTDEASKTAQTQLTTAERQLLALDAMVIPLLGVNDNLISVEEAIRGLTTAEQMALLATEELARLDAQVGALITINSSVLSVAQAISNLNGAISALASAQASKPVEGASGAGRQVVGPAAYVDMNPDLAALYASGAGMAAGRTKAELGAYHWERYGQGESRTYAAFAAGGDHMGGLRLVGEEGPELEATGPSRIYNARQTAQMLGGDNSDLLGEVRLLREEVMKLRRQQTEDNHQIKRNTKDSAQILGMVTQGDDKVRVVAA